ncbi:MAG: DUF4394 domain-containing protein [Elsteraceae bacterium]
MIKTLKSVALAACAISALVAADASAQTFVALTGDRQLTMVDAKTGRAGATMTMTGPAGKLIGIDVRPSDKRLYGLLADGTVVTINAATGAATMKVKLQKTLAPGVEGAVDFNPVADRLRIIGADGASLRANVDDGVVATDGSLKYADADAQKGAAPRVTAAAYSNSAAGATATTLYDIDVPIMSLTRQVPPNDGVLNTIGLMNLPTGPVAFDIAPVGASGNLALVVASGFVHTLNLADGMLTRGPAVTGVRGAIRDIAILP